MSDIARIKLTHSSVDWEILEKVAEEAGSKDLFRFLTRQFRSMADSVDMDSLTACEDCSSSPKWIPVHEDIMMVINALSTHHCIGTAAVLKRFITDPILREKLNR